MKFESKKEIVVYWANKDFNYEIPAPDYAIKDLHERVARLEEHDAFNTAGILRCPIVNTYLKNTFRIKSPVDYSIILDTTQSKVFSRHYDQKFFDDYVFIRDAKSGVVSFSFASSVFFTEEESLIMELKHANYATNALVNNTSFMGGEIDIGRYCRMTDYAFFINRYNEFLSVNRGDPIHYVRFLTDKRVVLKKFNFTDEIKTLISPVINVNTRIKHLTGIPVWKKMEQYYSFFKSSQIKKLLIKKIKENLLDA